MGGEQFQKVDISLQKYLWTYKQVNNKMKDDQVEDDLIFILGERYANLLCFGQQIL